jgi:2-dehydropantoate 2-reductase
VDDKGEITVRPAAATHQIGEVGAADLIVFATKNYHLEMAARELAPLVTKKTIAIPLLNGVNAPSILERCLPESDILGGCIYISAYVERPGTVRQVGAVRRVLFGKKGISEAENRRRYDSVEQIFRNSGITVVLTGQIDVEMWSKFIFLSPFAGVTTLYGRSISEILADKSNFETVTRMIHEIEALARAKNIALPKDIAGLTIEKARSFAPLTKTSMQLDQEKDRMTELESLIGYVCREGETLKVPLPTYEAVYGDLKKICKI